MKGWLGLETLDVREIPAAIAHFEHAVDVDPRYALAYAGLATAEFALYEETRADLRPAPGSPRARDRACPPRRPNRLLPANGLAHKPGIGSWRSWVRIPASQPKRTQTSAFPMFACPGESIVVSLLRGNVTHAMAVAEGAPESGGMPGGGGRPTQLPRVPRIHFRIAKPGSNPLAPCTDDRKPASGRGAARKFQYPRVHIFGKIQQRRFGSDLPIGSSEIDPPILRRAIGTHLGLSLKSAARSSRRSRDRFDGASRHSAIPDPCRAEFCLRGNPPGSAVSRRPNNSSQEAISRLET